MFSRFPESSHQIQKCEWVSIALISVLPTSSIWVPKPRSQCPLKYISEVKPPELKDSKPFGAKFHSSRIVMSVVFVPSWCVILFRTYGRFL